MKTPDERLADLYARAASGPRDVVTYVNLTSSGALHHCCGAKPGAFGMLGRMPRLDPPVELGVVYVALAESEYVETVLGYLLVAAVADLEAHPSTPPRVVGDVRWVSADPIIEPGVRKLAISLEPNMEDFTPGIVRGAAMLQRPFTEMDKVEALRGTVASLELIYGTLFRRDESPVQLVLRAMRGKPAEDLCQGFQGRVWNSTDGQLLHALAIYLRACAVGGLLDS